MLTSAVYWYFSRSFLTSARWCSQICNSSGFLVGHLCELTWQSALQLIWHFCSLKYFAITNLHRTPQSDLTSPFMLEFLRKFCLIGCPVCLCPPPLKKKEKKERKTKTKNQQEICMLQGAFTLLPSITSSCMFLHVKEIAFKGKRCVTLLWINIEWLIRQNYIDSPDLCVIHIDI